MVNPGIVLRRWRLQQRRTQEWLERETGLRQSYLSKMEKGTIDNPGLFHVDRIARALGHTLDELMAEVKREDVAARLRLVAA
jgi:transcriptional regulator with XRE-family HTH domain